MNKDKILYVSDLDGTLLQPNQRLSEFAIEKLNAMSENGLMFSFATARSLLTARQAAKGLIPKIPVIVHNGSFICDYSTGEIVFGNYFDERINYILSDLSSGEIYPMVYSMIDGEERFSYIPEKCTEGMKIFLETRPGDKRRRPIKDDSEYFTGDILQITCIDEPEKLMPLFEKYREDYHCILADDLYTKRLWLEILPKNASKSASALKLKEMLGCGKLIVFGDGKNDIDMFAAADEAYAVENADEELKKFATAIIEKNISDGVVKWLTENT